MKRILIIAGSDSGGGAGIQGDIKTVTMLGGFATTAITALTAQNTRGVFGIHEVPCDFIAQQMELVLSDIGADAIKTGMLHSAEVIHTIATCLTQHATHIPLVVDPVMIAKGGAPLLKPDAVDALKSELLPLARIVTPNIPEAELLSGIRITGEAEMLQAAEAIAKLGPRAVLIKGGHMEGDTLTDLLWDSGVITRFTSQRIATTSTHGTGCTLASAIATGLAQGVPLAQSVEKARDYVAKAIRTAPAIGHGHGPLNHLHPLY